MGKNDYVYIYMYKSIHIYYNDISVEKWQTLQPVWRRNWQPTLVFLPGKPHRQRILVCCSPQVTKTWAQLNDRQFWPFTLDLSFSSLIHFEFIFVFNVSACLNFILFMLSSFPSTTY